MKIGLELELLAIVEKSDAMQYDIFTFPFIYNKIRALVF